MNWGTYYAKDLGLKDFMTSNYVHTAFFESIIREHPKKVLEIGVGSGLISTFLSHLGFEAIAIDNDQSVIDLALANVKKLNGKVEILFGDAFKLPFADDSFDLIVHQGFFEHFSDAEIKKLVKEQLRVAKKIIFSVPNNFYPLRDYGNERLLTKKQWEKILSEYNSLESSNYCFRRIKKRLYFKRPIMYLAKISA